MLRLLPRLIGILLVLAVPAVVLAVLLAPWVVDGLGPNRSSASGLGELPLELWPLVVVLPVVWIVVGVRFVWQRL